MTKNYIILVNGTLAKTRKTMNFAVKDKAELEAKGYTNVVIAYKLSQEDK